MTDILPSRMILLAEFPKDFQGKIIIFGIQNK